MNRYDTERAIGLTHTEVVARLALVGPPNTLTIAQLTYAAAAVCRKEPDVAHVQTILTRLRKEGLELPDRPTARGGNRRKASDQRQHCSHMIAMARSSRPDLADLRKWLTKEPALSYSEIAKRAMPRPDGGEMSQNHLRYMATATRLAGYELPVRPRSNWKD